MAVAAAGEALGSGLGYRPQFRADLFAHRSDVDFLEIIADHYFDASPEKLAELDLLRAHFPLVAHGLDLSIGSAEGIDPRYLDRLARLIGRIDPPWWSEHLCFTKAGGVEIGHLAAVPYTQEAIEIVARNVAQVRIRIRAPLILENVTTVVRMPGAEMDEPEFLTRVLARTGCGWLCDVANLYANAVNHGVDIDATFERWPWDRLVQVHYAGGRWREGVLIDSHDAATSEAVWALFARIVARAPIKGAILERDERLPAFQELLAEVTRARQIMTGAVQIRDASPDSSPSMGDRSAALSQKNGAHASPAPIGENGGLARIQSLMAHLFIDASFRRDFVAAPFETAARFGLSEKEAGVFATLDTREIEGFARSLVGKRVLDARKALPLTAKALGRDFERLLQDAIRGAPAPERHRADAAALADSLSEYAEPPWIGELARYEMTFVAAARPGALFALRRFVYPVDEIVRRLRTGGSVGDIKPHGRVGLWLRAPGGKLRFWMI